MEDRLIHNLIKYRWWLAATFVILTVSISVGAKNLFFANDYQLFFSTQDPHRIAHETQEQSYGTRDSLAFIIKTNSGDMFTREHLSLIEKVTKQGWQMPFSVRVDSVTNFQHSWAAGHELQVNDLVDDASRLSADEIAKIRNVAVAENQLLNRLISADAKTTMVNVSLELPPAADQKDSKAQQTQKRKARDAAFPAVVAYANEVRAEVLQAHPELEVHLLGVPITIQSFKDSAMKDAKSLTPAMYVLILLLLAVFLRSAGGVFGTSLVIVFSTAATLGFAGFIGYAINTITVVAPTIVLTIAVCDSVHLLHIYLRNLSLGQSRMVAMRNSLRVNVKPIVVTSFTTAIGFLTLNFADSPPFNQLGNMSAFGVIWAMFLSLCMLPALSLLMIRSSKPCKLQERAIIYFSRIIVRNRIVVFAGTLIVSGLIISMIPLNQINDDPVNYFKDGIAYRDAVKFTQQGNLPGTKNFNISLNCGTPGCVNDPKFLRKVEALSDWFDQQYGVESVATYVDIIKRLNRNMHAEDAAYYRLPQSQELSAQYNLMYELSLPYGLDLTNQINFDKSATNIMVFTRQISSEEFIQLEQKAQQWFAHNYPQLSARGSSLFMMFAHMSERNLRSMGWGMLYALLGITLTIMLAMRSIRYSIISMVPNMFPALISVGAWGLLVGEINMGVAIVFSVTLGIVVDDTVHFINKYRHAREQEGLDPESAIEYAFTTVGQALLVTTAVLVVGFSILGLSDFNINAYMGQLTAIAVSVALIFDFLLLPALLLMLDSREEYPVAVPA